MVVNRTTQTLNRWGRQFYKLIQPTIDKERINSLLLLNSKLQLKVIQFEKWKKDQMKNM